MPSRSARVTLSVTSCPLFVTGSSVPRKSRSSAPPLAASADFVAAILSPSKAFPTEARVG